jgi:hypothetical protein
MNRVTLLSTEQAVRSERGRKIKEWGEIREGGERGGLTPQLEMS